MRQLDISIHVINNFYKDAPSIKYDHRLDKKVEYDQNGVVNLRKLTESLPSLEASNIKKINEENNTLKQKYFSLQVVFTLFSKKKKIFWCKLRN